MLQTDSAQMAGKSIQILSSEAEMPIHTRNNSFLTGMKRLPITVNCGIILDGYSYRLKFQITVTPSETVLYLCYEKLRISIWKN